MQMPCDIAGITHIFQKLFVCYCCFGFYVFQKPPPQKKIYIRTRNYNAITQL